jgi:hypothetical protein
VAVAAAVVLVAAAATGFKVVQVAQVACRSSPMDQQSPVMALNLVHLSTPLHLLGQRQLPHHVPLVLGRAASPHRTPPHVEETDVLLFNIL